MAWTKSPYQDFTKDIKGWQKAKQRGVTLQNIICVRWF
jgi:hypothetical protein